MEDKTMITVCSALIVSATTSIKISLIPTTRRNVIWPLASLLLSDDRALIFRIVIETCFLKLVALEALGNFFGFDTWSGFSILTVRNYCSQNDEFDLFGRTHCEELQVFWTNWRAFVQLILLRKNCMQSIAYRSKIVNSSWNNYYQGLNNIH